MSTLLSASPRLIYPALATLRSPCLALILALALHTATVCAEEFAQTLTTNKCLENGKLVYTDQPCPDDATQLPFTPLVSGPNDAMAAHQRFLADKRKLEQIDRHKVAEDKQMQRDAQSNQRRENLMKERDWTCKNLDLKRQMAHQEQRGAKQSTATKKIKKLRLVAQQAENNYARHCTTE